jgi:DNA polymerase-3 subunit gamma/tau
MFATTEPEKVLPTILSRCQRFDLRRIPSPLIVRHLAGIAEREKVKIDDAALYAIARGADGGMRDAESTLDQLISFCGEQITENDVLSMFGLTARSQILGLSRAILNGEAETALRELNELARHGKDLGRLLSDLLGHFRNLLIFQVSRGDMSLLEVSEQEAASLTGQTKGIGSDALARIMEVLSDCEARLRDATSKKILVEIALIKAIEARDAVSVDAVLKQLQQLRADTGSEVVTPAPQNSSVVPPAGPASARVTEGAAAKTGPRDSETPNTGELRQAEARVSDASNADENLEQLWHRVVEAVGRASPFTRSYLLEAHPVSFSQNLLTIGFDPEFADHLELVDNAKNRALIQTKLSELGFSEAHVKFIKAEAPANRPALSPAAAPAQPQTPVPPAAGPSKATNGNGAQPAKSRPQPVPFNKDDFKNDPLIQKALEVFKGQIVEVRA